MQLTDYWGVGPKTRAVLTEEFGREEAVRAIEDADVRALTEAGLPRGRATGIVRRALGDGLTVLATRDARDVYKQLLDVVRGFAVNRDAEDRVSVMTPFLSPEDAMQRLDRVYDAMEAWESLSNDERQEVLEVLGGTDDGGRRAAVRAALELEDLDVEGEAFQRVQGLDAAALEDALESLTYLDDGVGEGADQELDRLRKALEQVEELRDGALDVVEELRSGGGVRNQDDLEDAFVDYVAIETDVSYDRVGKEVEEEALDATDFVTSSLRGLADTLRSDVEERERRVEEELQESLSDSRGVVDEAVEAVDELGFVLTLARFSMDYGYSRPRYVENGVAVRDARNLELLAGGVEVQPVTYGVGEHSLDVPEADVTVLTGANSGGKTTLLETVCQTVLLAQMGLPVPAEDAEVAFFDSLVFHRRHASFNAGVLESTLRSVVPPLAGEGSTLMLVDEFEAITEPGSAADLLHGIVTLTVNRDAVGVFVTHLADDLEPLPPEARTDGIFAEGLDSELELQVDYQPRFETVGRSTPEFIVSRLIARSSNPEERMGFETLASAVGVERVQRTLDEI